MGSRPGPGIYIYKCHGNGQQKTKKAQMCGTVIGPGLNEWIRHKGGVKLTFKKFPFLIISGPVLMGMIKLCKSREPIPVLLTLTGVFRIFNTKL